jgi:hypothetical protein
VKKTKKVAVGEIGEIGEKNLQKIKLSSYYHRRSSLYKTSTDHGDTQGRPRLGK